MLQVHSLHKPADIGMTLRRAAERHRASINTLSHLGQLLRDRSANQLPDAVVFSFSQPEIYAALLAADIRFSAFLPWHIAAYERGEGSTLEAVSPVESCHMLHRPDLEELATSLETAVREVMEEAARPLAAAATEGSAHVSQSRLGATEEQMNVRGTVPQRIDQKGSKVEDLAGTGEHDSSGG